MNAKRGLRRLSTIVAASVMSFGLMSGTAKAADEEKARTVRTTVGYTFGMEEAGGHRDHVMVSIERSDMDRAKILSWDHGISWEGGIKATGVKKGAPEGWRTAADGLSWMVYLGLKHHLGSDLYIVGGVVHRQVSDKYIEAGEPGGADEHPIEESNYNMWRSPVPERGTDWTPYFALMYGNRAVEIALDTGRHTHMFQEVAKHSVGAQLVWKNMNLLIGERGALYVHGDLLWLTEKDEAFPLHAKGKHMVPVAEAGLSFYF